MRPDLHETGPTWLAIGDEALARAALLIGFGVAAADRSDQVELEPLDREVAALFHRKALAVKAQRREKVRTEVLELLELDDDDLGTTITVAEAAPILGLTVRGVRFRAQTGTLPGWKKGRDWQFDRDEIERIAAAERSA